MIDLRSEKTLHTGQRSRSAGRIARGSVLEIRPDVARVIKYERSYKRNDPRVQNRKLLYIMYYNDGLLFSYVEHVGGNL